MFSFLFLLIFKKIDLDSSVPPTIGDIMISLKNIVEKKIKKWVTNVRILEISLEEGNFPAIIFGMNHPELKEGEHYSQENKLNLVSLKYIFYKSKIVNWYDPVDQLMLGEFNKKNLNTIKFLKNRSISMWGYNREEFNLVINKVKNKKDLKIVDYFWSLYPENWFEYFKKFFLSHDYKENILLFEYWIKRSFFSVEDPRNRLYIFSLATRKELHLIKIILEYKFDNPQFRLSKEILEKNIEYAKDFHLTELEKYLEEYKKRFN